MSNRQSFRLSVYSEYSEPSSKYGYAANTPHANIVSDILSCILLVSLSSKFFNHDNFPIVNQCSLFC
jgi:hypothetical protein